MQIVVTQRGERKLINFNVMEDFLNYIKENGGKCIVEHYEALPPSVNFIEKS